MLHYPYAEHVGSRSLYEAGRKRPTSAPRTRWILYEDHPPALKATAAKGRPPRPDGISRPTSTDTAYPEPPTEGR